MSRDELLLASLEAVLFAAAKPLSLEQLSDVFELPREEIKELLEALRKSYIEEKRGLAIQESEIGVELITAPHCVDYVSRIRQKEDSLSSAALEVLSIIAFKQPVTKAEVEELRGVNSERVLKQLVEKNFIEEVGKKDTPGRPILYGTTSYFLHNLGITSLGELKLELLEGEEKEQDGTITEIY